ncbi:hypothetical protein BH23BAC3_BH23BAC3_13520 [soil metagenome]
MNLFTSNKYCNIYLKIDVRFITTRNLATEGLIVTDPTESSGFQIHFA